MECVFAEASGQVRDVTICQTKAHTLFDGASLSMVGAVDEVGVFAVGLRDAAHLPSNPLCTDPARFDVPVRGPVLFVATDREGEQMRVDKAALLRLIGRTPPSPRGEASSEACR